MPGMPNITGMNVKEIRVFFLIISILIGFLYFYKSPILSSNEAIINVEQYLLNPAEEWGRISFDGLEEIPEENIQAHLFPKPGFLNELFNKMQWEITIKSSEMHVTVIIDGHNGDFIGIFGAHS